MKETIIELPAFGIIVSLAENEKGAEGNITSTLSVPGDYPEDQAYNAAINGIENLVLAHACAGLDITSPAYLEGLETAVNAALKLS